MESLNICEICNQICNFKHKKTHYKNYNEFTFGDMMAILSYANFLKIEDKNIIFEKIKQVLNEEYQEFKNSLTRDYNLIMVNLYEKKYLKKIENEFALVKNYYTFFSKNDNKIKNTIIESKLSFEEFIKEIRKTKVIKRRVCLHCCKYFQNLKNHNFFINREKKINGCRQVTYNLINSKEEDALNFIVDIIKYDELSFAKSSTLELKKKLLESVEKGLIKINVKTENDVLDLYEKIKKLFLSDGRIANQFVKTYYKNVKEGNVEVNKIYSVICNENINNIYLLSNNKKNDKKNLNNRKRNLNLLDVINNELYIEASNNLFLDKRNRLNVNPKDENNNSFFVENNTTNKNNSDSTEYSINNITSNFPDNLENQINNIFNKYV